jgi:type II secretory pathway pseudopilin PulG
MLAGVKRRGAFSMIEVMMALVIVLLLVSLSVVHYESMTDEAQEHAARGELDVLRNEIRRLQLERRAEYALELPPRDDQGRDRRDPWAQLYRVDPAKHIVYSIGPDGRDDRGEGDDLSLKFDAYASIELKPPTGFKVAEHAGDWVRLTWNAVQYQGGVKGYNVFRRASAAATEFTTPPQNAELVPATETPEFRDEGLAPGEVYYYALEVVANDGTSVRAPAPLGFQIALEGPPRLSIAPARGSVDPDRNVTFNISAAGAGAPLSGMAFDGQTWAVDAVEKTVTANRRWRVPGTYTLSGEATDAKGRKTSMEVQVEVRAPPAGRD